MGAVAWAEKLCSILVQAPVGLSTPHHDQPLTGSTSVFMATMVPLHRPLYTCKGGAIRHMWFVLHALCAALTQVAHGGHTRALWGLASRSTARTTQAKPGTHLAKGALAQHLHGGQLLVRVVQAVGLATADHSAAQRLDAVCMGMDASVGLTMLAAWGDCSWRQPSAAMGIMHSTSM